MSRRPFSLLLLASMLGGCGGSANQTSLGATATGSHSTTSSTATAAPVPKHKPRRRRSHGHSSSQATKASNVRLPATYVIHQGGVLSPPLITAPVSVTIALTVVGSDGRAHRVQVRSPTVPTLSVPAGGRASALIGGLRAGTYGIYVDGVRRGALVIGVAPGP